MAVGLRAGHTGQHAGQICSTPRGFTYSAVGSNIRRPACRLDCCRWSGNIARCSLHYASGASKQTSELGKTLRAIRAGGKGTLCQQRSPLARQTRRTTCAFQIENRELLVGDCLALTAFCLYKQITSLLFLPDFPGWTAPLHFNPVRFEELAIFVLTLCVSWVSACSLVGGYRTQATADLPTALARVSASWLITCPIAACNLILVTATEGKALVGDPLFGHVLPLAARGAGEPFVTAAGVLGLMAVWRAFYTVFLDFWNSRTFAGSPVNRYQDMCYFLDALRTAFLLCIGFNIILQSAAQALGEERIEMIVNALLEGGLPIAAAMDFTKF